eukprot:3559333-Amphidinium_carterae.1
MGQPKVFTLGTALQPLTKHSRIDALDSCEAEEFAKRHRRFHDFQELLIGRALTGSSYTGGSREASSK